MYYKGLIPAIYATAAALVLSACAPGRSGHYADLRGATLEVVGSWSGSEQQRFVAVLTTFSKRTGAHVIYTSAHGHVPAVLDARLARGAPPDVALLPQPGLLRRYAANGRLVPLSTDTARQARENYAPVWQRLAAYRGGQYGVWFKAANKSLIWYDIATFERIGLVPPSTLGGLVDVARALRAHHVAAFSVGAGEPWTLTDWFENIYLRTAGPSRYDALTAGRLAWTDPSVAAALRSLCRLLAPPFLLGGVQGTLRAGFDASVQQAFTRPASAAMVMEGDFVAGVLTSLTAARIGSDVDVFPFPGMNRQRPMVVGGGDVAVEFRRSAAAAELMRYLASPQAAALWAAAGGFISPNLNLDLSVYPDPIFRAMARSLIEASDNFRFDLSDVVPAAFGADPQGGIQAALRRLLRTHDIWAAQRQLEAAAASVAGS